LSSERDAWRYELYEVRAATERNDYVEVQTPDANAEDGPSSPATPRQVTAVPSSRSCRSMKMATAASGCRLWYD
jgi:hypothetical protein